jgi:hypothetical protein
MNSMGIPGVDTELGIVLAGGRKKKSIWLAEIGARTT